MTEVDTILWLVLTNAVWTFLKKQNNEHILKAQTQVSHLHRNICPPLSLLQLSGCVLLLYYVRLMLRTK